MSQNLRLDSRVSRKDVCAADSVERSDQIDQIQIRSASDLTEHDNKQKIRELVDRFGVANRRCELVAVEAVIYDEESFCES